MVAPFFHVMGGYINMNIPKNFYERVHSAVRKLNNVPYRFYITLDGEKDRTCILLRNDANSNQYNPPIALILDWEIYRDSVWFELRQTRHGKGTKGVVITNGLIPTFNLTSFDKFVEYIDSLSKTHFEYHTRNAEIPEWLR